MRSALLVLAVTACSNLPAYQAECGNGVVDEHEDCDSPTGCVACALPCNSDATCPAEGYVCGGDGLCHAPGGAFRTEPQGLAFNAPELFVTDVNGDRVGDVIGVGATSLLVDRGILYRGPGPQQVIPTPFVTGVPAITSFDSDQTTDLVLPTAQSIVAYTSPLQELAPYPFALDVEHDNAVPLDLFQFDAINIGLIGAYPNDPQMFYVTIDITNGAPVFVNETPICSNIVAQDFEAMEVHDASSASEIEKIVAITGGGQGCTIKVTSQLGAGLPPPATATELVKLPASHRLVLAAVTPNTLCPDLLDGLVAYPPTGSLGACGVATTSTDLRTVMTTSMLSPAGDEAAIGAVELAPYYVNGYAPEALATNYGIYLIGADARRIYHSDRQLDHVQGLDIDGDGDLDVAASAANLDDIDFLYRFHPPAPASDGFQLVRYDTVAHPHKMFAADFDGNHVTDLAYTEKLPFGERLMVAYGTTDRPLAPIQMSVFRDVVEMTPGFLDATDPSGTLTDLSVLDYDAATARPLLTLMHGSPDRTLVPNFDPRVQGPLGTMGPEPSATAVLAGIAAGKFGDGDHSIADLYAVDIEDTKVKTFLDKSSLGAFSFDGQTQIVYDGLVKCGDAEAGTLCADHAHYLAWPMADHDAIIAVEDRFNRAATLDYTDLTKIDSVTYKGILDADSGLHTVAPPGTVVHSLQRVDLDGDGTPELIVSYGSALEDRISSTVGKVLACHVGPTGSIDSCDDLEQLVSDGDGGATCIDATSGIVGRYQRGEGKPFPPPELVIACHRPAVTRTDIFRITHDADGLHAVPLLQLTNNMTVERIFLGDVTGDGVADLLALDVESSMAVPILLVYTQCNSRDLDPECVR
jgi:hypothetical protein